MSETEGTTTAPPDAPAASPNGATPAERLFQYSTWVHVGPDAENCEGIDEERGTNECSNPLHFHAWCRLPNQFQHREIREKAMAAKARRARQLRDPETDAYAILEGELDAVARQGDGGKVFLLEELMSRDWWRDWSEAVADIREKVYDDEEEPRYARMEADQARFVELDNLPEDERPKDEYDELERHLKAYNEAVDERQKEVEKPRRDALEQKDINGLIDQVRDYRIDQQATEQFMHVYSMTEWLLCTLHAPVAEPQPVWASLKAMEAAAPEVLVAVKQSFEDLERTQQQGGGAAGNS